MESRYPSIVSVAGATAAESTTGGVGGTVTGAVAATAGVEVSSVSV